MQSYFQSVYDVVKDAYLDYQGARRGPEIIVAGPLKAGKRSFVYKYLHALGLDPDNKKALLLQAPEKLFVRATLHLFELSGPEHAQRFYPLLKNKPDAIVFIIDGAGSDAYLNRVAKEFKWLKSLDELALKPILVLANNRDLSTFRSEQVLSALLDIFMCDMYHLRLFACNLNASSPPDPAVLVGLKWLASVMPKYE